MPFMKILKSLICLRTMLRDCLISFFLQVASLGLTTYNYLEQFCMVSLGHDIFVSCDIFSHSFDILSHSCDILSHMWLMRYDFRVSNKRKYYYY